MTKNQMIDGSILMIHNKVTDVDWFVHKLYDLTKFLKDYTQGD